MKKLLFPLLFLFLICSCSKESDDKKQNFLSDINFTFEDNIDKIELIYKFPPTVDKTKAFLVWSTTDKNIDIINPVFPNAYFNLPESSEPKQVSITLLVSDGENSATTVKEIILPTLNDVRKKGLGRTLEEEKSNNVEYDWYFDQMITGVYSATNCGPSVAAMAVKWVYPDFSDTPEDAREFLQPTGGAMPLYLLLGYLSKNKVPHKSVYGVSDIQILKEIINDGNIAILGIRTYYISFQENNKWHKGRFYSSLPNEEYGHFIIVKGYKVVDGVLYYEIYDPFSSQRSYNNGQLMGVDRYFQWNELRSAFMTFGNDMIVVSHTNTNYHISSTIFVETGINFTGLFSPEGIVSQWPYPVIL